MNKPFTAKPRHFLGALVTTLVTVNYPGAAFCQSENIFKAALSYTAKIRTAVELPFQGDSQGVSKGAGFIVDKDRGWILTNAHVASRSPSLNEVAFHNTEYTRAKKLYVDPYLDLAVLEVAPNSLPKTATTASLECRHPPPRGHAVGAFGHPHELSYTGTRGIISGRTNEYGPELVQTDTPINRGNSGGPLVSMVSGRVIGISTASVEEEDSQNLNFAIPIEHTCKILELLRSGKDPSPPEFPVIFTRNSYNRNQLTVAVSYLKGSNLDLRPGDIIEGVEGYSGKITNESTLMLALRGRLSQVRLKIRRNNQTHIAEGNLNPAGLVTERKGIYVTGLLITPVPFIKDAAEVTAYSQLLIPHVDAGSIGASKEIMQGDFIQLIDGRAIDDLNELHKHLRTARKKNRTVTLLIKRIAESSYDELFEYREHNLPIENLQLVGGKRTD